MFKLNGNGISGIRPPLKWPGGKRKIVASHLAPLWRGHEHRRLVEPFAGGAAMTFGVQPERVLLNDSNRHLIHFYRWLQRGLKISFEMRNEETFFYRMRTRFNQLPADSEEAAGLLYYLNQTDFNGMYRENSKGEFTVPFGKMKPTYRTDFFEYKPVLERWELSDVDFEQVALDGQDFIYADPPYVPKSLTANFVGYTKEGFTWRDQVRLANWLARHPGPVVASNHATPDILRLYQGLGFDLIQYEAARSISCKGKLRIKAAEILATRNFDTQHLTDFCRPYQTACRTYDEIEDSHHGKND